MANATATCMIGSRAVLVVTLLALALPFGAVQAQGHQRSAQSDCTREAQRRGYTVLATSNFRQLSDGWQLELRVRDQKGRVSEGTCFVETRSGDVTVYGLGWGGSGSVEAFEFNCSSVESKYSECQLPIDGRVRLVKRKSDSPCVEGRSWGRRGDRVWVKDGCRARFEVTRGGDWGGGSGPTVDCRSANGRYRECPVQRHYVARLARDYSGRCRENSSWGNRPGLVWVTNGCQARFELVQSGGASGGAATAERACLDEARRQGLRVVGRGAAKPIPGGYGMRLEVRRGNHPEQAVYCTYRFSNGRAELRY